jgi:hypothetical protein
LGREGAVEGGDERGGVKAAITGEKALLCPCTQDISDIGHADCIQCPYSYLSLSDVGGAGMDSK